MREANEAWMVLQDPAADANGFLLRHTVDGTRPDARFGRDGQTAFILGADSDAPASVRVDATRRVWMVGVSLAGSLPQPVIARFLADGQPDLRWGVQGKLQITPAGTPVQPNDLLPLADGSVLVAGEAVGLGTPHAVVFHLSPDGALDGRFGSGGVWQRPGDGEPSTATSLAASPDGAIAVAVAVRGGAAAAELWAITDAAPTVLLRQPLDDRTDGEDLRAEWALGRWALDNGSGATGIVPAALLAGRAPARAVAGAAASDPGAGAFNPFADEAASAPAPTPDEDGLPWRWLGAGAVLLATAAGVLAMRRRRPASTSIPPSRD